MVKDNEAGTGEKGDTEAVVRVIRVRTINSHDRRGDPFSWAAVRHMYCPGQPMLGDDDKEPAPGPMAWAGFSSLFTLYPPCLFPAVLSLRFRVVG